MLVPLLHQNQQLRQGFPYGPGAKTLADWLEKRSKKAKQKRRQKRQEDEDEDDLLALMV